MDSLSEDGCRGTCHLVDVEQVGGGDLVCLQGDGS